MSILLVRHGLSEANNRANVGGMAFGAASAPLMKLGRDQAALARAVLEDQYGIELENTAVATSDLLRTQQTARLAGFTTLRSYAQLDEVKHGLDPLRLRAILDSGQLPKIAIEAAEVTLANPPAEKVWFSHGLRIAGVCAVLGIHQELRLIPRFCEIRQIEL